MKLLPGRLRTALGSKQPQDKPGEPVDPHARPAAPAQPVSYVFEDLSPGMSASYTRVVHPEDIAAFAALTGDTNPVHLDKAYASGTVFQVRIVHGMLTASYISTVLGTKLPGAGAIYISQTLKFRAPVFHGDEVTARVEVVELIEEKNRVVLACTCHVEDRLVLEGEAVLMVPRRTEEN
ncbi:MAG: MaoC family dehydratase [Dichotomicrobium sp.]